MYALAAPPDEEEIADQSTYSDASFIFPYPFLHDEALGQSVEEAFPHPGLRE